MEIVLSSNRFHAGIRSGGRGGIVVAAGAGRGFRVYSGLAAVGRDPAEPPVHRRL